MFNKYKLLKIYLWGLYIIPIFIISLPKDYFDSGQSLCLSVVLLDKECYGCGMTRGVHHLLHFDFIEAYQFNKLSVIVLPLLLILWVKEIIKIKKQIRVYELKK